MHTHYPFGCTDSHIAAADPMEAPLGICTCCTAYCFAGEDALVLPGGVLCRSCLSLLPAASLRELVAALAPAHWTDRDIDRACGYAGHGDDTAR